MSADVENTPQLSRTAEPSSNARPRVSLRAPRWPCGAREFEFPSGAWLLVTHEGKRLLVSPTALRP